MLGGDEVGASKALSWFWPGQGPVDTLACEIVLSLLCHHVVSGAGDVDIAIEAQGGLLRWAHHSPAGATDGE